MDYGQISVRRVLFGFSLTAFVALLPALLVFVQLDSPFAFLGAARADYGGLVLGAAIIVLAMILIGLSRLTASILGGRVVRRPFRA